MSMKGREQDWSLAVLRSLVHYIFNSSLLYLSPRGSQTPDSTPQNLYIYLSARVLALPA